LKTTFSTIAFSAVLGSFAAVGQVQHNIAAANIVVVQNDTGNTTNSVTVSTALSINDFRIRTGSNRGDYNVQIGSASTDDVTGGILIGCIDQNGRDNGELDTFPGMNYGSCSINGAPSSSPGADGNWSLATFQAPKNSEYNFNVAAGWFPYSDGWYGGWLSNSKGTNGGANNHLIGNPNLVLGTHVIDQGSGKTKINLKPFGLDSRSNAVLIVTGGKNEANFALSATNTDGTWTITCRDDNGGAEQDFVGFVCVPLTNHSVVSGRFMGDGKAIQASESFSASNTGVGVYHLTIPGVNPADGVLLISAESGGSINGDNMVNYQANGDGWDIQTRDITVGFTPALQTLDKSNSVVSFVYIPGPPRGATTLRWSGATSSAWNFSSAQNWKLPSNTPTNYSDNCVTILDDSASNFSPVLGASVSPYQLTVSNVVHDYAIQGTGKIIGSGSFTKLGVGKLTLSVTNQSTGDTMISQGRLVLNADNCLPSGVGFGNTIVNGTLDLAGFDCALNNLSGSGTVDNSVSGAFPRLHIFQSGSTSFLGTIKNTVGSLSVNLDGGGVLNLAGANSISGGIVVSNATLKVSGFSQLGSVSILSKGRLSGTGFIDGAISMDANSALDLQANSPLTVGAMTLNGFVAVNISGVSMTNAASYLILQHGAISGAGSFKLILPPGVQANGFSASLVDSGTQLRLVVTPAGITGTIADVRHVIIYMNENRSFDHYFGTLHGVRGFNDRSALQLTNGNSIFYQPSNSTYELPFHNSLQCLTDLNHSWTVTHATVNEGWSDTWIANKKPETMCYYDRGDLPFYYALADAFTICDEYHCSVLASTDPNRFTFMTGMIDPHGNFGGPEIDNSSLSSGFRWKTYPEFLQDAGVSWKTYLVSGNSGENVITRFAAFKNATPGTPLYDRGRVGYSSLTAMINGFKADVMNDALPSVSWVVGVGDHSEHPPNSPASGQYVLKHLLEGLASNPEVYKSSVFIYNYDENDGFFDHAMPILPPAGTPDEFVGNLPVGLGIRVPAFVISPWSRGGRVCSQVFDHTSVIRFLETWTGVIDTNISAWRRQVCGDLTSAFDFAHPNFDFPSLPDVSEISCPDGDTPAVPSPQIFPTQESGTLVPLPLPYQPNASCILDKAANTFTLNMTNSGAASVHFGVYANAYRAESPLPFDVDTTNSASVSFSTASTGGKYDFSCYGPNGFQRRFAGNVTNDAQKIEAVAVLNPSNRGITIQLINFSSSSVTFSVTNGYVAASSVNYSVPAHTTNFVNVGSETNNGDYDVTVKSTADSLFLRRFLGRVEAYTPPTLSGGMVTTNGAFRFSFSGPSGQPYHVLMTTGLEEPANWEPVLSGIFSADPVFYTEENPASEAARFYRVVSP
jgi:phospholipase C